MVQKPKVEMEITKGMLAGPLQPQLSRAAALFISDRGWKNVTLENRRAQGPQKASGRRK